MRAFLPNTRHLHEASRRRAIAGAGPRIVVRVCQGTQHAHVLGKDCRGLQVVAKQALACHLEHAFCLELEAANRQRTHDIDGGDLALDNRIAGTRRLVGLVFRHVEAAMGGHNPLELGIVERHQVQLVEHGATGLRGATSQWQQGVIALRAQHALKAPIALDHQVVVDVFGIEVRGAKRVVVAGNRTEAAEQEVRASEQQWQRVRGATDVRRAHLCVVAGARLQAIECSHHVLGEDLAHAVRHGARHVDAIDTAVLCALRAGRARDCHAARLEVEHRLTLGATHQNFGTRPRGEAHLEAARRIRRSEQGLRPGGVVAIEKDLLGAIDRDRLGIRRQTPQA